MTPAQRESLRIQTAAAREKALADSPTEISEHGWSTLNFLFTGSSPQQQSGDAA